MFFGWKKLAKSLNYFSSIFTDFLPLLAPPSEWGFWVSFYATPAIVALGLIGNTLCFVVMKRNSLRTRSYSHFLCALAVFDSITLIGRQTDLINVYLDKHTRIGNMFSSFSDFGCKMYFFSLNTCYLMSAWLIVCMSIERLQAVCFPFKKTPWRRQEGAVGIILSLFLVLSLSQFFRFTYFGRSGKQCGAYVDQRAAYLHWHIYEYMFTFLFGLPFSIVLLGNFFVLLKIRQIRNEIRERRLQSNLLSTRNVTRKRSFKTTATLLTISFSYVITMLPLLVISIILHVIVDVNTLEGIRMYVRLKPYSEVISTFSYINYSINFCIYVLSGKFFRREVCQMFQHQKRSSSQTTRIGTKVTGEEIRLTDDNKSLHGLQ